MLQGFFGFVLGGVVVAVLLANEPQLVRDVQSGLHDLRLGARQLASDREIDRHASSERDYEDRRDERDRAWRDDRRYRDRYDNEQSPPGGDDTRTP